MGLPASGSGKVHKLSSLDETSRREIERRIFGLLPQEANRFYKEYRDRLSVTFDARPNGPDPRALDEDYKGDYYESDSDDDFHATSIVPVNLNSIAVRTADYDFKWRDFHILFNSRTLPHTKAKESDGYKFRMRTTVNRTLIEQYIRMVCAHANKVRNADRVAAGRGPRTSVRTLNLPQWEDVRVAFGTTAGIREATARVKDMFETAGIDRQNFRKLDYLFMPVHNGNHYLLYVFAPQQKRVICINSYATYEFEAEVPKDERDTLFALLRYLVPRAERDHWILDLDVAPNFDEWTKDKEAGRAVRQRDSYNCGINVATNALCLAFGYDLKCWTARDLDQFRKQRMVAEFMNGGMNGFYNYDVLEIPREWDVPVSAMHAGSYRRVLEQHRAGLPFDKLDEPLSSRLRADDSDSDDSGNRSRRKAPEVITISDTEEAEEDEVDVEIKEEDEEDEGEHKNSEPSETEAAERGADFGYGDDEQRGLDDVVATIPSTKKLPPLPIFPTASQCVAIDRIINVIRPESINMPDPQYTHHYGFLYPFYHVEFDEAIKCSKEEMLEACARFPIANYEEMSALPKEEFLDWIMNEMGATMSRIHRDPIPPCPGMGDGYEIWLTWPESKGLSEPWERPKCPHLMFDRSPERIEAMWKWQREEGNSLAREPLSMRPEKLDAILAILGVPNKLEESKDGKNASSLSSRTSVEDGKSTAPSSPGTIEPFSPRTSPRFARNPNSSSVEVQVWVDSSGNEVKESSPNKRRRGGK